jgi:pilus assembly protein CpaF
MSVNRPPTGGLSGALPGWRGAAGRRRDAQAEPIDEAQRMPSRADLRALRQRLQRRLINELNERLSEIPPAQVRSYLEQMFNEMLEEEGVPLPRAERLRLFDAIAAEILAYGPIEPLLQDDTITEIMVNGPDQVWIERNGILEETDIRFENDEHVRRIIERIIAPLGRRCDESSPMVDARLPDGSRVNAIIPPLSLIGPVLTIRKFSRSPLTAQHLIEFGTISPEVVDFLAACVRGRLNILVAGGTSSGKTTLLNILSGYIPNNERIITIEDAAELQLRQRHVIPLERRPANIEGKGEITIRDLVINALRMRPDRIIIGECRGPEALDMLQAMNTGHEGSMTTLHANSPRDTISRLETMVLMAGMDLPLRAVREQIASAIDLIVYLERMHDGVRRVTSVTEVQGMEGDVVTLQELFTFHQYGVENRRIIGQLVPTGVRPKFLEKLEVNNIHLPPKTFGIGTTRPGPEGDGRPRSLLNG